MKKITQLFFAIVMMGFYSLNAQVGINSDNSTPDNSAMLDVKSSNKGFLPPRVALTALNSSAPITTPAVGLLVYNTVNAGSPPYNVVMGYYYWNGTKWISVAAPQGVNVGDMLYWDGLQWVGIPVGLNGRVLTLNNGVPNWGGAQLPVLNTTAIFSTSLTTANSGGSIASDGGSPVTTRGVCWNITPNPTIANSNTNDGTGTGSYTSYLTNLSINTLYYLRAYATNNLGTAYGDQVSFTNISFAIGQSYGGGIIFYLDGTGQHGLITATTDQGILEWGCGGTLISGTSTALGSGQANTLAIVNVCNEAGIAARICNDLILNGYSDWFLPSQDELNQIHIQYALIGSFSNGAYWSSSEYDQYDAYYQYPNGGAQGASSKLTQDYYVRAIRAF